MRNIIIKKLHNFIQAKDLVLTAQINQIFLNHIHEMNKYDNLELTQHHNNILQTQNPINTQSYQLTQMHNEIPLPKY